MLLALVKINPPSSEGNSAAYVPSIVIQGRRFMTSPYAKGEKPYLPNCQCNGVIVFENIQDFVQAEGKENHERTKELLKEAAKVARDAYANTLDRSCLLATAIPVFELFATMLAT